MEARINSIKARAVGEYLTAKLVVYSKEEDIPGYTVLKLSDGIGLITAVAMSEEAAAVRTGNEAVVKGYITLRDGEKSLELVSVECVRAEETVRYADTEGRISAVKDYIREVTDPVLKTLLNHIYTDEAFRIMSEKPGGILHHNYPGGLLDHIYETVEIAVSMFTEYCRGVFAEDRRERDLAVTEALLCDIGKISDIQQLDGGHYTYAIRKIAKEMAGDAAIRLKLLNAVLCIGSDEEMYMNQITSMVRTANEASVLIGRKYIGRAV